MTPLAVRSFERADRRTRLHTRLRWWWCPFPALARAVPASGRILEVGCGHGLLSLHLAIEAPGRTVHGVDLDEEKILAARRAAADLPGDATDRVSFEVVPAGWRPSPEPAWDAVVFADVLYLLPEPDQRDLVVTAARAVAPGGVLVVKEMGLEPAWKLRWNRYQETLATRLGVTASEGRDLVFVAPEVMAGWARREGLEVTHRRIDRGYPWPHHLLLGHRPDQGGRR